MSQMPEDVSLLPQQIFLLDRDPALAAAWQTAFAPYPEVTPSAGDYFQQPADAMVSPANSFGIMDGGLDLAIRNELGFGVQALVQEAILEHFHGELPVGSAVVVETGDPRWKHLIAAPTMRIPERVSGSIHAYLAFRAVLVAIENFNRRANAPVIGSLVCCGLATGVGGMSAERCAGQMLLAYKSMRAPAMIGRFESLHAFHAALRRV